MSTNHNENERKQTMSHDVQEEPKENFFVRGKFEGFFTIVNMVERNLRECCFEHGMEIEILKTGFIRKTLSYRITVYGTRKRAEKINDSIMEYFRNIGADPA